MSRRRKRISPPDEFTRFCETAEKHGWTVFVVRWVHEEQVLLQVLAVNGQREVTAPSVTDVTGLAGSVAGLIDRLEREAA